MKVSILTKTLTAATLAAAFAVPVWAQTLEVRPEKLSGIYAPGEKIAWTVRVTGTNADKVTQAQYQIKKAGATVVGEGTLDLSGGKTARIETTQTEGMTYLAETTATGADGKKISARGGAVVASEKIGPSQPKPADFDAFWKTQIARLNAIPAAPQVEAAESGRVGVDYWKVTLQNVNGKKVQAQMACPHDATKHPAIIALQYAGVYPLDKKSVVNRAAEGWLVLNVMAHDLPIDAPADFYTQAAATTLRDYAMQGNESRESSYLLPMVLGDIRAVDYLAARPEWDGKTLVAMGTSQGGFQSIAVASLSPKVTHMIVNVPAGCDTTGPLAGRAVSWPYWLRSGTPEQKAAITETSRYFDNINFAYNIQIPSLVALGLVDQTSVPSGVFAMFNQIKGLKEVVVMPLSDHKGAGNTQAAYYARSQAWLNALQKGEPAPLAK